MKLSEIRAKARPQRYRHAIWAKKQKLLVARNKAEMVEMGKRSKSDDRIHKRNRRSEGNGKG